MKPKATTAGVAFVILGLTSTLTALAATDSDGDGVPDDVDNCPHLANAPGTQGVQVDFCSPGGEGLYRQHVHLWSRSFLPPAGIDPTIDKSGDRVRAYLHVTDDGDGLVLSEAEQAELENLGIEIVDYIPYFTHVVNVPTSVIDGLEGAAWDFVHGLSAIRIEDKFSPEVWAAGTLQRGLEDNGSLTAEITLWPDANPQAARSHLETMGIL